MNEHPGCVGYEGGCDGDLVGMDHEPNCPAYGKADAPNLYAQLKAAEASCAQIANEYAENRRLVSIEMKKMEAEIAELRKQVSLGDIALRLCAEQEVRWASGHHIVTTVEYVTGYVMAQARAEWQQAHPEEKQ